MSGPLGFPGLGYKHPHTHQDPYVRGNEYYRRNRDTLFGDFANHQRHTHSPMFGGHSSPFGRTGGYPSPFTGLGGMNPMGGYPAPGYPSPLGGMGMGMGMGMGSGMRLSTGLGFGMGIPGRPQVTRRSPMAYQRPSPFGYDALPRAHSAFPHRHGGYPSWSRTRRSPFSSRLLDDDPDDDDSNLFSMYEYPNRRRNGFRHYRWPTYGRHFGGGLFDDYDDDYDEYDDFDEEDDEEDYGGYVATRPWQRY